MHPPKVDVWENSITGLQCGGRPGIGADVAHHIVQCHQALAQSRSCPSAILFLDIRSAFYTVLRQAFIAVDSDDAAFIAAMIMMQLGITPDELTRLTTVAAQDDATAGLAEHHQHVVHDLMSNTFFTIPGI